jgi:hypothetical protein
MNSGGQMIVLDSCRSSAGFVRLMSKAAEQIAAEVLPEAHHVVEAWQRLSIENCAAFKVHCFYSHYMRTIHHNQMSRT